MLCSNPLCDRFGDYLLHVQVEETCCVRGFDDDCCVCPPPLRSIDAPLWIRTIRKESVHTTGGRGRWRVNRNLLGLRHVKNVVNVKTSIHKISR